MKLMAKGILVGSLLLFCAGAAQAQQDNFGALDTVYAEVSRIDDYNWSIHISYFNDENVVGMSVPLKLSAGQNKIVADSCIYTGGRVEHFSVKAFRADTAIQCVTLGMIGTMTASRNRLEPGKGRLATVFVSSLIDEPIEQLKVDTATTYPNNTLEVISDSVPFAPDDDTKITDMAKRRIIPAFVVMYPE